MTSIRKSNIAFFLFVLFALVSSVLTSFASNFYTTYTFIENIWLITGFVMFFKALFMSKRILDIDLKASSTSRFEMDADGTWIDTQKERIPFRWIRRISYIAVILNIIFIFVNFKGTISVFAAIFEVLTLVFTIIFLFKHIELFSMYGNFIIYSGKKTHPDDKPVVLIYDIMGRKLAPFEEYKAKLKDHL